MNYFWFSKKIIKILKIQLKITMKKDIEFPQVVGVYVAVLQNEEQDGWEVFLINENNFSLTNVFVTSTGYLAEEDNPKKMKFQSSTLRHSIPILEANEYAKIEPIDESVFHICNEYWVSYYVNDKIFDKKFIFLPNTIAKENFIFIEKLGKKGVLHG